MITKTGTYVLLVVPHPDAHGGHSDVASLYDQCKKDMERRGESIVEISQEERSISYAEYVRKYLQVLGTSLSKVVTYNITKNGPFGAASNEFTDAIMSVADEMGIVIEVRQLK